MTSPDLFDINPDMPTVLVESINFEGLSQSFAQSTMVEFESSLASYLTPEKVRSLIQKDINISHTSKHLTETDFRTPQSLGVALARLISEALHP